MYFKLSIFTGLVLVNSFQLISLNQNVCLCDQPRPWGRRIPRLQTVPLLDSRASAKRELAEIERGARSASERKAQFSLTRARFALALLSERGTARSLKNPKVARPIL